MRIRSFSYSALAMALGFAIACNSAFAFDLNDDSEKSRSPFELFKFGFSAYKNGHKDEAIKALRYAADRGQQGAKWKLARMYADGDGVPENDYEAYKIFEKIVREGSEPGSENDSYVADALVALAGYVKRGIPGSPVNANPSMARDLYVARWRWRRTQFRPGSPLVPACSQERQCRCAGHAWKHAVSGRQDRSRPCHDDGGFRTLPRRGLPVDTRYAGTGVLDCR